MTYELRTKSGRLIRATREHRFLTDVGWRRLQRLRVGDCVYVDGGLVPQKRKVPRYLAVYGLQAHPHAAQHYDRRPARQKTYWSVQKHRVVYEADLNGLEYEEYVERLRRGDVIDLQFINPTTHHVHHKNADARDNRLENLELVDRTEHLRQHGKDDGWRNVTARTVLDEIVNIERYGREETFDLCVDHSQHNFIADGFVVHNSGKTEVTAAMLAVLSGYTALIVVPTKKLLRQTRNRIALRLGTIPEEIGVIGDGKFLPKEITVACLPSIGPRRITAKTNKTTAKRLRAIKRYIKTVEVIFLDEGHHAQADTWYKLINAATRAQYRYILSGTPFGSGNALMVEAAVCPVVAKVTNDELVVRGVSAKPYITMLEIDRPLVDSDEWQVVYKEGVVFNDYRNQILAYESARHACAGNKTLILVQEIAHGDQLRRFIKATGTTVEMVHGEMSPAWIDDGIARFVVGQTAILIASPVFGEGVDIPAILAGPVLRQGASRVE